MEGREGGRRQAFFASLALCVCARAHVRDCACACAYACACACGSDVHQQNTAARQQRRKSDVLLLGCLRHLSRAAARPSARPPVCPHPRPNCLSYDVVERDRPHPVPHAEAGYADVEQQIVMAVSGGVSITHYADGSVSTA